MGCVNLKPRRFLMLNMRVEVKGLITVCLRTHGKACIMDVDVLFLSMSTNYLSTLIYFL